MTRFSMRSWKSVRLEYEWLLSSTTIVPPSPAHTPGTAFSVATNEYDRYARPSVCTQSSSHSCHGFVGSIEPGPG